MQVLAAGQAPSAVYGAEHLLRLVVKLPELLPQTGVTGEALQLLIRRLEDLLTYLQVGCGCGGVARSLTGAFSPYIVRKRGYGGDVLAQAR